MKREKTGLLITYNKAKYTLNKSNTSGNLLTYNCSSKQVTKYKAKCQVPVIEFESEIEYVLSKFTELSEYNHPTDEGEILT